MKAFFIVLVSLGLFYNVNGQVLIKEKTTGLVTELNLENLVKGVYHLKFESDNKIGIKRLLKQ